MTLTEVAQMVESIGLPFAYYESPDDTRRDPPFVCYLYTDSNDMYADDQNWQDIRTLVIELYTKQKDLALENQIRQVLNTHNQPFTQAADFIADERVYISTFTTEVVING